MKKTMVILVSLIFIGGIMAFAQAQKAQPKVKAAGVKIFTGQIDTITLGDPAKNTKTEITIKGEKESLTVTVSANTKFTDLERKPTTVDKLKVGDKVHVRYIITAAGANEAGSINLMK
jgi:hypothetical protein